MQAAITEVRTAHTPESLVKRLVREPGVVLLRGGLSGSPDSRYSFAAARPFLTFRSCGSMCEVCSPVQRCVQYGNPWRILEGLVARYEMLDQIDVPFPLGGCFGYWGYELNCFVEPRLSRNAVDDLGLPHCQLGFHDSLVAFDHALDKVWIISTGLEKDGSRNKSRLQQQIEFWRGVLSEPPLFDPSPAFETEPLPSMVSSNTTRAGFLAMVSRAQQYIRAGDIYQVNLSHRLSCPSLIEGWDLYRRLLAASPAPLAAYLGCGQFELVSASPELFLRLSGRHARTRPIKGTRPRSNDRTRDLQLAGDLQTSAKEMAELVMITDLLRNDLGRISEYGSVRVTELARLEQFSHVQHLVSTVESELRPDVTHCAALAACFPGGSITGAPKVRAMEIIDELEPAARGPYTGCMGFLGFNRESCLSIVIRTAICCPDRTYFQVGAGIVADSIPAAEYDETLAKAHGFLDALSPWRAEHSEGPELAPSGNRLPQTNRRRDQEP